MDITFTFFTLLFALVLQLSTSANLQLPPAHSCLPDRHHTDQPMYGCSSSMDWMGDGYSNRDCLAVVQRLYFVEVSKHRDQEFEFLAPGARPRSRRPVMQTPRRYTVGQLLHAPRLLGFNFADCTAGKCTLAIVMLENFTGRILPGEDPQRPLEVLETDIASFTDLWLTADLVEACCLGPERHPGWAPAGKLVRPSSTLHCCCIAGQRFAKCIHLVGTYNSIGVFIWTASCYEDRLVPRGVPTIKLLLNATASE